MHVVVVLAAQRDEVVEVGVAAVFPFGDVMSLAPRHRPVAVRPSARGVDRFQRRPLMPGCRPVLTADIDGFAVIIQPNRSDVGVAAQPANRFVSEFVTIHGFADRIVMGAVENGVGIKNDGDIRSAFTAVAVGQQLDQRQRVEVGAEGDFFAVGFGFRW